MADEGWIVRSDARRARAAQSERVAPSASRIVSPNAPAAAGPSAPAAPTTSAIASTVATAVSAERARCRAIIESPEAVGREESSRQLAFQTGLDAAKARQLLAGMHVDAELQADAVARRIASHARRTQAAKHEDAQVDDVAKRIAIAGQSPSHTTSDDEEAQLARRIANSGRDGVDT